MNQTAHTLTTTTIIIELSRSRKGEVGDTEDVAWKTQYKYHLLIL